ncbi:S8 family serine peptidase [Dactylosporangium sp. NPDC051541]|uniref:S8 family serine peptidase n=1 Tax=Dactylosporangium sp. NPDC051541 TaxID=3363977 RepID=UPI0037A716E8
MSLVRRAGRSVLAGIAVTAVATAATLIHAGAASAAAPADAKKQQHPSVAKKSETSVIKDSYVVLFKSGVSAAKVDASAAALTKQFGGSVTHTYKNSVHGFAANMNAEQAKKLAGHADVALVEPNRTLKASDTQVNPPSWGLDRIDAIFAPLNKRYNYPNTAGNVHAYVIDSGIRTTHTEFGGRATSGYDFIDNDTNADDCLGHGTHVAGTIGGTNYGVAKQVKLVAVRVLGCDGFGTTAQVVAGIDWVTANAIKPAVANMSLGGDADVAIDNAVQASISSGITYAVAAGNEHDNACNHSPARVPTALTVGAANEIDFRTDFSNYGPCVDLHAPGHAIPSSFNTSDTAIVKESGTSMASPHVAGAAALALGTNPTWTPTQVSNYIVYGATRRTVRNTAGIAGTTTPLATTDTMLRIGEQAVPLASGLRSLVNGKNISVGANGVQPIMASSPVATMGDQEKFTIVSGGTGYIAFASWVNGKYISATAGGTGSLIANASTITDAERFQATIQGDGTVVLMNKLTGKYVTVPNGGNSPLVATASTITTTEKFIWASPAPVVALRAQVNSKLVTTPNGGANPLIASVNATASTYLEQFDVLDLGDDGIALRAHSNKKYVSITGSGLYTGPLTANSTTYDSGYLQKFWVLHDSEGVVLMSQWSGYLVQAPNAGNSPLAAQFDWDVNDIDPSVLFNLEPMSVN